MNTDPEFYWLTSYIRNHVIALFGILALWRAFLIIVNKSSSRLGKNRLITNNLPFKLHDFGARGVCLALNPAALGALAHLVNFSGTDTLSDWAANRWYGMQNDMTAFSIPAAEHSTMTTFGDVSMKRMPMAI